MLADPENLPLGKQLKLARVAADLSSTEVARSVGISIGHLSRIESGQRKASDELVAAIRKRIERGAVA